MMTKLHSGQGKREKVDADADTNAADQSNTYMLPFQATKCILETNLLNP